MEAKESIKLVIWIFHITITPIFKVTTACFILAQIQTLIPKYIYITIVISSFFWILSQNIQTLTAETPKEETKKC